MPNTLQQAKTAFEAAHAEFVTVLTAAFPGMDEYHWLRADAHVKGHIGQRNEDTSRDVEMAAHVPTRNAWDSYIAKLHAFYLLRDGPGGVLGGRA